MSVLVTRDLVFADRAPWTFDFVGTVNATPDEVWAVFIDNRSWETWFHNCRKCEATSDPFDGVGSTRAIEVNGLRVEERFIAWQPGRLWAFTATAMRMSFATSLVERATFEETAPGRTTISYRMAIDPKFWARPLKRLIGSQAKPAFRKSFAALDTYLADQRARSAD